MCDCFSGPREEPATLHKQNDAEKKQSKNEIGLQERRKRRKERKKERKKESKKERKKEREGRRERGKEGRRKGRKVGRREDSDDGKNTKIIA